MNQRTFFIRFKSQPEIKRNFYQFFSVQTHFFTSVFDYNGEKLIACEMFLRLTGCPKKGTKGWNEMKVHFVIFCNCAQFLMKAAKVHCCSQHNEMAAWMWKFMMKIKSLTSTFLTLPSLLFPSDFICCHSISHPVHVSNTENCWSQHKNLCLPLAAAATVLRSLPHTRES